MERNIRDTKFLGEPGVYGLVDGQFGSTGKGLAAAYIENAFWEMDVHVSSNAGPNSGHTSYKDDEKHVLMQLPTFSVHRSLRKSHEGVVIASLNAGAIVNLKQLEKELDRYPNIRVDLHPNATIVDDDAIREERVIKDSIGSTGKGTGAALARKIMRSGAGVARSHNQSFHNNVWLGTGVASKQKKILLEVSQGFSLGINQRFYPYCTSRECTIGQAMTDAGFHPEFLKGTMMVVRTFPIRVGGNSGGYYDDQTEISWDDIGVEPERTTVTNKERRVFTWSNMQYKEALIANRPSIIFLNFCNYLKSDAEIRHFVWHNVYKPYWDIFGRDPELVLLGHGPKTTDVKVWDGVSF